MAGLGQRFAQEGYLAPKPLVKVQGECILDLLLKGLDFEENDHLYIPHLQSFPTLWIIPILKKYCNKISIVDDLGHNQSSYVGFGKINCTIIQIALPTRGATETLFIAGKMMESKYPLLSLDCDNVYSEPILNKVRALNNSSVFYFHDTQKNPIYSYIQVLNEQVTQIQEKVKISDMACSGGYFFSFTKEALELAQEVLQNWNSKELYISFLFELLLKKNHIVRAIHIQPISFGVPMAVETFSSKSENNIPISKKIICFDADSTLLTPPKDLKDYSTCEPINETCEFVRYLYSKGHTIIIHTARGMLSFEGNTNQAEEAHRKTLEASLAKFNIPYHSLIFGKPYADFYIDDKAVSTFSNLSRETGFYPFSTPVNMTHNLKIDQNVYIKTGKLEGEYWWYKNIPSSVSDLFPPLLPESDSTCIRTPRISGISFSQKFLAGTLTITHVQALLHSLERIHNSISPSIEDIYQNYLPKLEERMGGHKNDYLYQEIAKGLSLYDQGVAGVIHGDPVFTNVFLTETYTLLFIDMRGKQGSSLTIFGDRLYDFAKVYQSLTGYDAILHEKPMPVNMGDLIIYFEKVMGEKMKWIYLLTASMYYTLIPLHINESPKQLKQYEDMAVRLLERYKMCS